MASLADDADRYRTFGITSRNEWKTLYDGIHESSVDHTPNEMKRLFAETDHTIDTIMGDPYEIASLAYGRCSAVSDSHASTWIHCPSVGVSSVVSTDNTIELYDIDTRCFGVEVQRPVDDDTNNKRSIALSVCTLTQHTEQTTPMIMRSVIRVAAERASASCVNPQYIQFEVALPKNARAGTWYSVGSHNKDSNAQERMSDINEVMTAPSHSFKSHNNKVTTRVLFSYTDANVGTDSRELVLLFSCTADGKDDDEHARMHNKLNEVHKVKISGNAPYSTIFRPNSDFRIQSTTNDIQMYDTDDGSKSNEQDETNQTEKTGTTQDGNGARALTVHVQSITALDGVSHIDARDIFEHAFGVGTSIPNVNAKPPPRAIPFIAYLQRKSTMAFPVIRIDVDEYENPVGTRAEVRFTDDNGMPTGRITKHTVYSPSVEQLTTRTTIVSTDQINTTGIGTYILATPSYPAMDWIGSTIDARMMNLSVSDASRWLHATKVFRESSHFELIRV